ncbi:hypothetical protein Bbelb_115100 [Branchiostoma belcheri]|nr:hypothetical protein Bbelb_115100 [Branchiostoma belcheri]
MSVKISLVSELSFLRRLQVYFYFFLPWRELSRLWGAIQSCVLPAWLRGPIVRLYCWLFGANLKEALVSDPSQYTCIQDFFTRQLRPNARPLDPVHRIVSPADGTVVHFGRVTNSQLEQVKGVTYSLERFLGRSNNNWGLAKGYEEEVGIDDYQNMILEHPDVNSLFHITIYLAPGDYHRFHSPADWEVLHRRHFPGALVTVNPWILSCVNNVFNLNERVVLSGRWSEGFFSMSPVGATNVGSIKIYFDTALYTNNPAENHVNGDFFDHIFLDHLGRGVELNKGDQYGEFNLGSTIVLVFEAPKSFVFNVHHGQKIRVGQSVGCFNPRHKCGVEMEKGTQGSSKAALNAYAF